MNEKEIFISKYDNGNFLECITLIDEYLKENINDFEAYAYKGSCLMKNKLYAEAIENFTTSISIDGTKWYVWTFRGDCYFDIGDYENALIDFKIASNLNHDEGSIPDRCGRALFLMGRADEGIEYMYKSIQIADTPEPALVLMHMLKTLKMNSFIKRVYDEGVEKFPQEKERFDLLLE